MASTGQSLRNYYTLLGVIWIITYANAQSCSFPGSPAHSSVTFSNDNLDEDTVASYTCERGFELLGPARRVCENGQWAPEGIPFCVLNVAAGKAPMQSSTDAAGIPQKAIDGSTSSFYAPETCSLTKAQRVPWWYVNLLEPYMVQLVRLDFGKTCCGANSTATIVVRVGNNRPDLGTNPICNRFTGLLEEGQPLFLPCNPPMPGAFVSVHLETPGGVPAALSICEAFVYTDQALPIERCPVFRDQPPGASASYNGKCYIFYNRQPLNFRDALGFCRARGGTLINESNPALQGFISWELWRRHRSDASSQYWMGAVRDGHDRNVWKWVNGKEVTVSFWNLPGGNEDCTRYDGAKGWLWSDTNCNMPLNYICQHQPKACGRPEQPPNSTMVAAKGFEVGASVDYACDDGHLLVGPAARRCLETGFYDEFPPVCKYIECGLPASIPHGAYDLPNGTVGYLSTVQYRCHDGHEMVGRAMLTCDIDERWNGPPPRCEPIECDQPPEADNGEFVAANGTLFGARAELLCDDGYRLEGGARTILCSGIGQWSEPLAACVRIADPVTSAPVPVPVEVTTEQQTTQPPPPPPSTATATSSTTAFVPTRPAVTAAPVTPPKQRVSTQPSRRPTRPSTRHPAAAGAPTRAAPTATYGLTNVNDLDLEDVSASSSSSSDDEINIPGTVRVTVTPRTPAGRPVVHIPVNGHANNSPPPLIGGSKPTQVVVQRNGGGQQQHQPPPPVPSTTQAGGKRPPAVATSPPASVATAAPPTTTTTTTTTKRDPLNVIQAAHPQDNEIASSVNIRSDQSPNVNIPFIVENDPARGESAGQGARLNLGAIVALSAFSGFVFLAAVIGVIVCMVKKRRTAQHYRHRASPDCNTVASFDSSSSESRNGLNRYYRQAWENLHESASKSSTHNNHHHNQLRRKETLDPVPPGLGRSRENLSRSRENLEARSRDFSRDSLGLRDGSEMVVADVCVKGEKKRHHHHHHKSSHQRSDYRDQSAGGVGLAAGNARRGGGGGGGEHRHHNGHY